MIVAQSIGEAVVRIRLDGCDTLDRVNVESLKLAVLEAIDGRADVVVDLSGIEFIDSTGVGVLVGLLKAARRSGRDARFACASSSVRSVLQMVKLDRIFSLHPDAASAAAAVLAERSRKTAETVRAGR